MAKSQLFAPPVLDFIYTHGGCSRCGAASATRRRSSPPTRPRPRRHRPDVRARAGGRAPSELGEPKPGLGRLALESGVPVVPVAIHGSETCASFARLRFPKVTVQYGEPISLRRRSTHPTPRAVPGGRRADLRARADDVRGARRRGPPRRARPAAPRAPRGRARHGLDEYALRQLSVLLHVPVHGHLGDGGAALVGERRPRPGTRPCRRRRAARAATALSRRVCRSR